MNNLQTLNLLCRSRNLLSHPPTWWKDNEAAREKLIAELDHAIADAYENEAWDAYDAAIAEPDRAQQMRDAGYTRRPTLREMAEPVQEPTLDEAMAAHRIKMYETALEEIAWSNNSAWQQDRAKHVLTQMRGVEL